MITNGYGLFLAHVLALDLALALALVLAHALAVAAVVAALLFVAAAAAVAVSFLHFDSPGRSPGSVQKALLLLVFFILTHLAGRSSKA